MDESGFFGRKEPRLSLEIASEYRMDSSTDSTFLSSKLKDVSAGGFVMESEAGPTAGGRLVLRFRIPHEEEIVAASCRVLRSAQASGGFWKTGLEIIEMDDRSREILTDYFDSLGYYGWYYR